MGAKCPISETKHYFEGGNIIAAGNWLLIGADIVTQTSCDPAKLARLIDPTRQPVVLSTKTPVEPEVTEPTDRPAPGWTHTLRWKLGQVSRQPMFHIDLFVAPAGTADDGSPRFLVGCPRQAAEIIGHPLWPHAMADQFDEIATQLTDAGADVIRNPLPLIWKDHLENRHRTWFHLPVNNVLVEDLGPGGRTVWLPGFASPAWSELAEIDNQNAAIWSMLGYSVIRIPGMMPLAENLGSLRCMAKVIARKAS